MAAIFGSQRTNNPDPVAVGLRVQSSVIGTPIPVGCGRTRWAGVLCDWNGFTATPVKSPGSKGGLAGSSGKGNTGQYNYSASGLVSLCEGGILAFNRIYNGNRIDFLVAPTLQEESDLNNIGINTDDLTEGNGTYNAIYHYGNWTDGPDSWWTSQYSGVAIAYPGQAYVIFPNLGLGSSPSFPSFNFDCTFTLSSDVPALGPDANPADWIDNFLTNADWGVQSFPSSAIGDFNTARNYWRATGMLISTVLTSPTAANSHLKDLIDSLNADFRWSNGKLDIVPYGDVAVTANGYTYTPNTTPVYAFGLNDYLPNQGSLGGSSVGGKAMVGHSRADVSLIPNIWQVEYLDRANLYNPVTIYHSNDADITISGKRRYGDKKQQHWFCLAGAASVSLALQLHRAWSTINSYQFTVGRQFILLDVLDLVTITEPALGLAAQLVRITEIQENSDGSLTMTAEEVPLTASAPVYARQPSIGLARNTGVAPGSVNAPVIFELPGQLSQALEVQIAVSGQNPAAWGGCVVWISTDGTNYAQAGEIDTPARMGVLSAPLAAVSTSPSGPTLDTTNTLSVNLSESGATLYSGSASDLANFVTLCLVDSELLAYQNATLTGTNAYNLTEMERGCYGTQASVTTHATGASFVRVDENIFRWGYTNAQIGQTIYFKFTSFNSYHTNEESLAAVTAYTHTLSGTPTPAGIGIASATLAQVGAANTLAVTWIADPLAVSYIFDYSTDGGATYTAVPVTGALSWQVPGLQVSNVLVRVAGVNANDIIGPYLSPVSVGAPPINFGGAFGLSITDLTSPAMQQQLDAIHNEEAIILATVNAAVASNTAVVNATKSANSAVTVSTLAQSTASSALATQITSLSATMTGNFATLTQTLAAQANSQAALSTEITTLNAQVNVGSTSLVSQITTNATAIASVDGTLAASYGVTLDTSGYITGIELLSTGVGTGTFAIRADKLTMVIPGYSAQPVMTIADVSGVPTLSFNGSIVSDGTILNPAYAGGSLGHSGVVRSSGFASTSGNLTITAFGRSPVLLFVTVNPFENLTTSFTCVLTITAAGTTIATQPLTISGGSAGSWTCAPTTLVVPYLPSSAGTVTFAASISNTNFAEDQGTSQYITLAAIELGA